MQHVLVRHRPREPHLEVQERAAVPAAQGTGGVEAGAGAVEVEVPVARGEEVADAEVEEKLVVSAETPASSPLQCRREREEVPVRFHVSRACRGRGRDSARVRLDGRGAGP